MALIIDESFEYQHKKFDQNKRPRNDFNSSSEENEYIDVENEPMEERPYSVLSMESSPAPSYIYNEEYSAAPASKRMRTTSFSDSSYSSFSPQPYTAFRHTSTPLTVAPAALAPTAAILPKISDETLRSICKYHGNMVRKFPKKQRTPKDQERRDKNTIACRMSRRVKKLEHIAIEEQYKEFSLQTFDIIEQAMRSTAYLHELMKLTSVPNAVDEVGPQETETKIFGMENTIKTGENTTSNQIIEEKKTLAMEQDKKPFSIAFLMGKNE